MSIPLSDSEVLRTRDDLEMMRRQHLWPNYFVLALKRITGRHSEKYQPAILVYHGLDAGKAVYDFFEGINIHARELPEIPTTRGGDELLTGLVANGWRVD